VQRFMSASAPFTMPSWSGGHFIGRIFMRRGRFFVAVLIILGCNLGSCAFHVWAQDANAVLGLFKNHTDVGGVLHPGAVVYDPAKHSYTISGSGENMWFATDAFQFVWKKLSGDVTLT